MTWVKICGTTTLNDAHASAEAGADALGFIFAPSPRRVEIREAAAIMAVLPPEVEKIGVFVDESPGRVAEIALKAGLTGIQLHGDEPPEQMADFRRSAGSRKIVKTLQARHLLDGSGERILGEYLKAGKYLDAILLDSGSSSQRGGTGIPFDWEAAVPLAAAIQNVVPLILAGGLNPGNVGQALRLFKPWGVDVVSGVESTTGRKDLLKLQAFVASVRQMESVSK
jgi:phosphoribosylanthranilate isomerase